jgi:hypothetical protein
MVSLVIPTRPRGSTEKKLTLPRAAAAIASRVSLITVVAA